MTRKHRYCWTSFCYKHTGNSFPDWLIFNWCYHRAGPLVAGCGIRHPVHHVIRWKRGAADSAAQCFQLFQFIPKLVEGFVETKLGTSSLTGDQNPHLKTPNVLAHLWPRLSPDLCLVHLHILRSSGLCGCGFLLPKTLLLPQKPLPAGGGGSRCWGGDGERPRPGWPLPHPPPRLLLFPSTPARRAAAPPGRRNTQSRNFIHRAVNLTPVADLSYKHDQNHYKCGWKNQKHHLQWKSGFSPEQRGRKPRPEDLLTDHLSRRRRGGRRRRRTGEEEIKPTQSQLRRIQDE